MSDYEYDFFISYRRSDKRWIRWVRENMKETLETLLAPALGEVKIFTDHQIEAGVSWPGRLAEALARSRILIPLLCRDYFRSDWCRLELALMREREKRHNFRCEVNREVLIIPFVYDDGDCFPAEVKEMQAKGIHEYANPFILPDTPKHANFTEFLRLECCERLVDALGKVPKFDPEWQRMTNSEFRQRFSIQSATQTTLPALSLLPLNTNSETP